MAKSIALAAAEWATFLVEHGVSVADAQTAAEHWIIDSGLKDNLAVFCYGCDALWGAFVWFDTPEGHDYWSAVCYAFAAKYNEHSR